MAAVLYRIWHHNIVHTVVAKVGLKESAAKDGPAAHGDKVVASAPCASRVLPTVPPYCSIWAIATVAEASTCRHIA